MREIPVRRPVAVPGTIAIDPNVVVPLQIIGLNAVQEGRQPTPHPIARGGAREAGLCGMFRSVLAAVRSERALVDARRANRREVDVLALDPDTELHAEAVRVVAERVQAIR